MWYWALDPTDFTCLRVVEDAYGNFRLSGWSEEPMYTRSRVLDLDYEALT